jgi:hypothetical protein
MPSVVIRERRGRVATLSLMTVQDWERGKLYQLDGSINELISA